VLQRFFDLESCRIGCESMQLAKDRVEALLRSLPESGKKQVFQSFGP
jgi:hypothetical protein